MIAAPLIDIDTADAVPEALQSMGDFIRATAKRIAHRNSAIAEELVQEAAIYLWQLDPTRFDDDDAWYLEWELARHMSHVAQAERRAAGGRKRMWVAGL